MGKYDDIINMEYHGIQSRMPMSMENRAAQFAPFAALSGHDEAISEVERITEDKLDISDYEKELNWHLIMSSFKDGNQIIIKYFRKDLKKKGGAYITTVGRVKKIYEEEYNIELDNGLKVKIPEIISVIISDKYDN